jgi:hypothetical protein
MQAVHKALLGQIAHGALNGQQGKPEPVTKLGIGGELIATAEFTAGDKASYLFPCNCTGRVVTDLAKQSHGCNIGVNPGMCL